MVGVVEVEKWEEEDESTLWGANEVMSGQRNPMNVTGDSGKAA